MSGPCLCGDPYCEACFPRHCAESVRLEAVDDIIEAKFPEFAYLMESNEFQTFVADALKVGAEIDHVYAKACKAIKSPGKVDLAPYALARFYEMMKFVMAMSEMVTRRDRKVDEAQYEEYLKETKLNKSIEDWKNGGQGGESTPGEHEVDGPPKGGTGHG